jgi:hypothetical protein
MIDEKSNKFSVHNESEGKIDHEVPKAEIIDLEKSSSKLIEEVKEQDPPS